MPFNTKSALGATRPLEIEYGGQTLKGQILASRLTPSAVARASREATATARAAERERDGLERALVDAEAASVNARFAAAGVLPEIEGKAKEAQSDPEALAREVERTQDAVYAAEDALAAFDEEALVKKIVYLSGEIAQALESWDAEYADGTPVPLEQDAIAGALPWQCVHQVFEAITEATQPTKKPSTASPSG